MYTVFTTEGKLIMAAPLATIERFFLLHSSAVARIEDETEAKGRCELNFNHRPQFGYSAIVVCTPHPRVDAALAAEGN